MENFLNEVNEFTYTIEELNEDGMPKKLKIKGIYQKADIENGNKRMYPRPVLEAAVKSVQSVVLDKRMLGELDHPSDAKIHLDKVSHLITKLEFSPNGEVYGEAEVLPTAHGKILESLLKSGVKLGISSRGFGSTKENKGLQEVQGDYKLVTFDIVSDPSTPGAFPKPVYEQKETEEVKENEKYITNLEALVDDILDDSAEAPVHETKTFVCKDNEENRFYIVEGEKDSLGKLNFHLSRKYHLLIRNEDNEERVALDNVNMELVESIYGERVSSKIKASIEALGYDSETLNIKKEE